MYFILFIIAILLSFFFYKGFNNTQIAVINTVKINQTNSPVKHSSIRILHISDMHLENISITPEQLYEDLKDQQIDLIALTGDFLDRKRTIPKLIPYLEQLNRLNPVYGSYAVFGNHDYVLREKSLKELKDLLTNYGYKTMQNEHECIDVNGQAVNIIGIDDFSTNRSNIDNSYKGIESGYNLVLTHDPNIVLHMDHVHFDYLLSGHFHGGQIYWPKPYHLIKMGKLVRMNMVKGLHYYKERPFYISEGLGQTGVNIRIGSKPEITLHEVQLQTVEKQNDVESTIAG
ncbi:metallophosphoesterase [Oceanobacillus senegalensis]|uniref:metallophosphoesterase n=1 Tax=Oceanobacillus senegalensis TaxID=1936063 RepID=UPI000A3080EF|nr:metallophosphoesterase [Oceanobacillus senegalensis]